MSERRKITAEDKRRIIEKSLDGISVKDISSMLSLKYSTVWRIVDQFNKTGDANEKRGGDTRSKSGMAKLWRMRQTWRIG